MAKHRFPAFKPDSALARKYQAEWADEIKAQGRDPFDHFPVAKARAYKLAPLNTTARRLGKRGVSAGATIPADAVRCFEAGRSYCQTGVTYVDFDRRGRALAAVRDAA